MTSKQKIIEGLDKSCDELSKKVANVLTENEAEIIMARFDRDISNQKGVTPKTTIFELRRNEDFISYKLSFQFFFYSSVKLS